MEIKKTDQNIFDIQKDIDMSIEVLNKIKNADGKITVLKFGAPWCAPCVAFDPIFDKLEQDNPDALFIKIDLGHKNMNPDYKLLSSFFNLPGIPTVVFLDSEGKRFYTGSKEINQEAIDFAKANSPCKEKSGT